MAVEVVRDDPRVLRGWVAFLDQPVGCLGKVQLGAPLGHGHTPPADQRFDHHEQVGGPLPHILVITPHRLAVHRWLGGAGLDVQHDRLLVEADGGVLRVIGLVVQVENVLNRGDTLGTYVREAPLLVLPRLELVLRKRVRMVSGEIDVTKPKATALPASRRSAGGRGRRETGCIRWRSSAHAARRSAPGGVAPAPYR
jgi:hypothetical protein